MPSNITRSKDIVMVITSDRTLSTRAKPDIILINKYYRSEGDLPQSVKECPVIQAASTNGELEACGSFPYNQGQSNTVESC